ncbi:HSPB1-associated protein 1 isoform X3 [Mustela erminea]|uniref:HSPB1-associated protein 1 isoform X3 n=1 Tax=Mustela erminea TaxID=36723 RepID=UPI00138746EA|nr:HSPB1-associated protein 1 isoform X3 [Mustela erminea]
MAATRGATTETAPAAGAGEVEGERVKPFTPEKAKEILMSLQQPAVFCNMAFDWPAQHWTAKHLSEVLPGKQIRFRMGMKRTDTVPQFETTCNYVEATLEEFLTWNCGQPTMFGPFRDYDHSKFWAYADYKYFVSLFDDKADIFQDVIWSDFGFPGRNGRESTLWIGSMGAHTPCHLDSYGCNLVFQVQGRKRWHLFPPEDTPFLYPTRIPYEESSVFSKINVVNPDLKRFPQFRKARRHTVTLNPGQVLFVPRHWWHYVESIDPVTVSINSWIELENVSQSVALGQLTAEAAVMLVKKKSQRSMTQTLRAVEPGYLHLSKFRSRLHLRIVWCNSAAYSVQSLICHNLITGNYFPMMVLLQQGGSLSELLTLTRPSTSILSLFFSASLRVGWTAGLALWQVMAVLPSLLLNRMVYLICPFPGVAQSLKNSLTRISRDTNILYWKPTY